MLARHDVVAVVTQPDRPAHRGRRLQPSAAKVRALAARLAVLGAEVLVETLERLDTLTPAPQRHEEATLAPRLKKTEGHLDWERPARDLANVVRGCNPWPGALTRSRDGWLTIWRARAGAGRADSPGTLFRPRAGSEELAIATAAGWLLPGAVQPEN